MNDDSSMVKFFENLLLGRNPMCCNDEIDEMDVLLTRIFDPEYEPSESDTDDSFVSAEDICLVEEREMSERRHLEDLIHDFWDMVVSHGVENEFEMHVDRFGLDDILRHKLRSPFVCGYNHFLIFREVGWPGIESNNYVFFDPIREIFTRKSGYQSQDFERNQLLQDFNDQIKALVVYKNAHGWRIPQFTKIQCEIMHFVDDEAKSNYMGPLDRNSWIGR